MGLPRWSHVHTWQSLFIAVGSSSSVHGEVRKSAVYASMRQLLLVVLGATGLPQTCTYLKRVQGSLQGKGRAAQAAHGRLVST